MFYPHLKKKNSIPDILRKHLQQAIAFYNKKAGLKQ